MFTPYAKLDHLHAATGRPDERGIDRLLLINRYYLFRKNFNKNFQSKIGFTGLIFGLFIHRFINRNWQGLYGLAQGFREMIIKRRDLISSLNNDEKNIG